MADLILHKRSSTASAVPSAGSIALGELAINTADGRLFLKKGDGTVVDVTSIGGIQGLTAALAGKEPTISSGTSAQFWRGDKSWGTLSASDVPPLDASKIGSGVIADARLSGTYTGVSITGNAATATQLATARLIGGVSFNGTANINLPGVNAAGTQNTSGNAATATALQTARTINGVSFNGTANITIGADWSNVTNKPATYAPSAHSHAMSDVTGLAAALAGKMTNPMTTAGDMIRGGTSGAPERVAAGTNGHVMTMVAGVPGWAAPSGGADAEQFCTAWVNFNGTGTVAIRDSYNVSSITDNGTGNYTVNFNTPMNNANYSAVFGGQDGAGGAFIVGPAGGQWSSAGVAVGCRTGSAFFDSPIITVAVFGGK